MSLVRFSKRLKQYREDRGLTQTDVANVLGVTKQTISNYENDRSSPSLEDIEGISTALGVSPAWLFGLDVEPNGKSLELTRDAYALQQSVGRAETENVNGRIVPVLSAEQAHKALEITARALDMYQAGEITEETLNAILKN